jgi:uncharacterized membrane protein (UPF0127 family)
MFWMRYAIDVIFLDDASRVVGLVQALRPWRISPLVRAATSVVEVPTGTIAHTGVRAGHTLAIEPRTVSVG